MSVLCDRDIRRELERGELRLEPQPKDAAIQPASVELHLGPAFKTYLAPLQRNIIIDPEDPADGVWEKYVADAITILPGQFMLGHTVERVSLSRNLAATVGGKSTLGRYGLEIHCTAGFIDPGFTGQVTLELHNKSPYPIYLRAGMAIAQLVVLRLSGPVVRPYGVPALGSRYQGSSGVVEPRRSQMRPLSELLLTGPEE